MESIDELRRRLSYNEETGLLYWRHDPTKRSQWNGQYAGQVAGGIGLKGYWRIVINGKLYQSHRVIWALKTGEWPVDVIDHKDRNRANNSWPNLREASKSLNAVNAKMNIKNTSGFRGVWKRPSGRWAAEYWANGKKKTVGTFDTKEEATSAHMTAYITEFGEFAA